MAEMIRVSLIMLTDLVERTGSSATPLTVLGPTPAVYYSRNDERGQPQTVIVGKSVWETDKWVHWADREMLQADAKKSYLSRGGLGCPVCGAADETVSTGKVIGNGGGGLTRLHECGLCHSTWCCDYALTDMGIINIVFKED